MTAAVPDALLRAVILHACGQAGEEDGSCLLRPMTAAELKAQSALAAGVH